MINQENASDPKTDEPDTISVDGTMTYFMSLGVNLEDASMLIPMEIVQAPTVGEISKEGFVNGWKAVKYVNPNPSVYSSDGHVVQNRFRSRRLMLLDKLRN